jgi:hypothetical protein
MRAYLKTQGVTHYIEHGFTWPLVWTPDLQAEYSAVGVTAERRKELCEIRKDYEDAVDSDNITSSIISIIQLKISSSLHHLCLADDTASQLWERLENSFNSPGAAGLFVDFQHTLHWKLDEKLIQVLLSTLWVL